eukprot:6702509-Pyramimonas_sp.AAC.1
MDSGNRERPSTLFFFVQRAAGRTWAIKDGQFSAILLDWSKAFDRVEPAALILALSRFGIPGSYLDMIANITAIEVLRCDE